MQSYGILHDYITLLHYAYIYIYISTDVSNTHSTPTLASGRYNL